MFIPEIFGPFCQNAPVKIGNGARPCAAIALAAMLSGAACESNRTSGGGSASANQSAGGSTQADAGALLARCPGCDDVLVTSDDAAVAAVAAADAAQSASASPAVVGVVLVAMRVRPTPEARGPDATVDLVLREDGTVLRRGALAARFEGERLIDAQGREVLRVAPDRVVVVAGMRTTHRLTDQGELRRSDGKLLRVEDDGSVVMISADGTRDRAPMRFEGFRAGARATASMLVFYLALQP